MAGSTQHRDLRTGQTVWQALARPRLAVERLERPVHCDIVVIGAGVSGAMVAEALSAAGWRVAVVDRRGPCRGSTMASTALLQFEIDTPLLLLSDRIGADKAARAWRRSARAVDDLALRVHQLRLRCGFAPRSTVYLAGNLLGNRDLQRETALRRRLGLPSYYLDRTALRRRLGIERAGAILSHGSAEADPVRLAAGFLRQAVRHGARLFAPVGVMDVDPGAHAIRVETEAGIGLTCKFVVFATGYELARGVPSKGHKISSTWAIATAPQPRRLWPTRDLIWEASDPYLYARTTPDGRVIAGGEDEAFADETQRDALIARKATAISAKLGRLLPGLDTAPAFRWTGSFGDSATGLPSIGEVPGMKRCYAVLGFGGNGITYSTIAAQLIERAIRGAFDPDVDVFRFGPT